MNSTLGKYLSVFARLKRGVTAYGPAPHKPVFLLTLIELIDKGIVTNNQFEVNADLVASFKENWLILVPTLHQPDFTQPFFYLQSEKVEGTPFWNLQPKPGRQIVSHIRSVNRLSDTCDYGYLNLELFGLLSNQKNRILVNDLILDTYFSNRRVSYITEKNEGVGYIHIQEDYVLNEPEAKYKRLIIHNEEDVFVRNGFFKKLIPKIYGNQCSFTGMRLSSTFGHSFVDACHIVPFSLTHNDKVTNGIALCPNLHRAFDRGLVSISNEYSIVISRHLIEDEKHTYALKALEGQRIFLPIKESYYPEIQALEWHRNNVFKS